uniref:JmjC domain-containing protein n=1 Tax=Phlebotomus papatasi TaxID=29031 RepID=A0A1B0D861_PHLPP
RECPSLKIQEDIRIPDYCYISSPDNEIKSEIEVKIWFGPWGTVSPLHFDKKHNLLAQVTGTKRLLLADPKDSEDVYPFAGEMLSNTSQVDLENVDELQFPNIKNVSFHEIILNSGEMLYIPPGWWHHPQIPALIQNCIEHWPARAKWSDLGYFIQRFGYRTVPIEIGSQYTESNWGQKLVRLKDFIDRQFISRKNDTIVEYLAQHDLLNQIPEEEFFSEFLD